MGPVFNFEDPKIITLTLKPVAPTDDVDIISRKPVAATAYHVTIMPVGRKQPLNCQNDNQPDGTVILREGRAAFSCFSLLAAVVAGDRRRAQIADVDASTSRHLNLEKFEARRSKSLIHHYTFGTSASIRSGW